MYQQPETFFPTQTTSKVTDSKTLSITAAGAQVVTYKRSIECISSSAYEPTVKHDLIAPIPNVLLPNVLEANEGRLGRFLAS